LVAGLAVRPLSGLLWPRIWLIWAEIGNLRKEVIEMGKEHPHDLLIHKLEECLDELRELRENYKIDKNEYVEASDSIESSIDWVRAINI